MKFFATLIIFTSFAYAEVPRYQGQAKTTKPLMERETGKRHVPDEDAQHQEAGPKGRQAQKAGEKGELGIQSIEEQKQKQQGN